MQRTYYKRKSRPAQTRCVDVDQTNGGRRVQSKTGRVSAAVDQHQYRAGDVPYYYSSEAKFEDKFMGPYWWGLHVPGWLWVLPLGFFAVCFFILVAYLFRGPRWFSGRADRRLLGKAAREILDRRYASGEITREQYEETRRVLAG